MLNNTNKQTKPQQNLTKYMQSRKGCLWYLFSKKTQMCFLMNSSIYLPTMICALEQHIMCNFPWRWNCHLLTEQYTSWNWRGFLIPANSIGCSYQSRFHFCYITIVLYLEWLCHNYFFLRLNIELVLIGELSYFVFSKVACLNNLSLRIKIST